MLQYGATVIQYIDTTCIDEFFFILRDNWKMLFFINAYCNHDVFFNRRILVFWNK